jgi:hypothetical protein
VSLWTIENDEGLRWKEVLEWSVPCLMLLLTVAAVVVVGEAMYTIAVRLRYVALLMLPEKNFLKRKLRT